MWPMTTRRDAIKTVTAAMAVAGAHPIMAADSKLTWTHFPAGEHGFFRAPVLIAGAHEAVLIDAGFTFPDGKAVAEAIKKSGKTLTTIYISQGDPDYYFSLAPIKQAFPQARIVAAPAVIAAIQGNIDKKLATWGPQLKENGPQTLADIVMPEAFERKSLILEGHAVEIVDAEGMSRLRYIRVPSLNAIFGGVLIFAGVHVWTADTPGAEGRARWVKTLDSLLATKPAIVVPGHLASGAALDASAIQYTRDYLLAFEEELAKAADSAALIAAMTRRYPDAGMGVALQIGAKVAKGEMKWG
jgi:glyoxylase-like metal-dependent hydrolase (beta-lactamase superfamily II)